MDFGALTEVDHVNWTLPAEDPLTQIFLENLDVEKNRETSFYVGAPIWQQKSWVGKIYPEHMRSADALHHYSRIFNCIELNSTHYRVPNRAQIEKWISQVPDEFRFLPKVPQAISHAKNGLVDSTTRKDWLASLAHFGQNLGPCFLQLPPLFSYDCKAELFFFLEKWPDEFELSIEFRHKSWFYNGHILPALTKYLQKRAMGLVITDVAGRRDVLHSSVSASFSMLRFIGNDFHSSDFTRMNDWVNRLKRWQSEGLRRFYFLVHQTDNIKSPETADLVIKSLNQTCNANLKRIQWVSLFNDFFESPS